MSRFEPIKPLYTASSSTQNNPTSSPSSLSLPINSNKAGNPNTSKPSTPQHNPNDDSTNRALANRLRKDHLLCKQLLSTFSKQQHPVQMQEFIAGGKISTITSKSSLLEAAKQMACHQLSTLIVINGEGQMSGLLGYPEMRRALANGMNPKTTKVVQVMQGVPVSVQGGVRTSTAMELMVQSKAHLLSMLEGDEIVGIIELDQLLQDISFGEESVIDLLNTLSDAPVIVAVEPKCMITELASLLESEQSNAALVIDGGRMVGVINMPDIVLRVIASGLDARSTSVVRVMTPGIGTVTTEHRLSEIRDRMLIGTPDWGDEKMSNKATNKNDKPVNHAQLYIPVMDPSDGSIVAMMDVFHLAAYVMSKEGDKNVNSCLLKEARLTKSSSFNALGWEPSNREQEEEEGAGGMNGLQRCDSRNELSETAEFDIEEDATRGRSNIRNEPKFVFETSSVKSGRDASDVQSRKIESEPLLSHATETSSESTKSIGATASEKTTNNQGAAVTSKRRYGYLMFGTIVVASVLTGLLVYKRYQQHKSSQ